MRCDHDWIATVLADLVTAVSAYQTAQALFPHAGEVYDLRREAKDQLARTMYRAKGVKAAHELLPLSRRRA